MTDKIKVILVIYLITFGFVYARDVQETVLRAHKCYEQGDIEKALELYNSIEKKGTATWYNAGNCHYKLGNYIDALICWKRAEYDATWNEFPAIYYNIDKAYQSLELFDSSYKKTFFRILNRFLSLCSLWGWQFLFLLAWVLLLFLVARLSYRRRYIVLSGLSLLVLILAGLTYMKHEHNISRYGLVTASDVILYAGPDVGFHGIDVLDKASEVTICQEQEQWLKVQSKQSLGWVLRDSVTII